jgi:hypothetical protein
MSVVGLGRKVSENGGYFWARNVNKYYPLYER